MIVLIGDCKIWKTGNSGGVTIPARICRSLNLKKGDTVTMYYDDKENKIEIFLSNKLQNLQQKAEEI
jgi:antitoxin component of MazEF toxin-antitoxin module